MKEVNKSSQPDSENEINLIEVAKTVYSYRIKIIIILGIFVIAGAACTKLSDREYTAASTFIPQSSDQRMGGNIGGLASLAGINLNDMGSSSEIPPALYPTIISSVKFQKALLNAHVQPEGLSAPVTYAEYYEDIFSPGPLSYLQRFTIGLPGEIMHVLFGKDSKKLALGEGLHGDTTLVKLTDDEVKHFRRLARQVTVLPDEKKKIVKLSFTMPEPLMAAQMARYAEALLQKELIDYKIQSAREQLSFTEQRFVEKKNEFETIQNRLAVFRDRNQNITSAIAMNQLDRMEAEYNFSFTIYTELAKQMEQAKLQVSKDTPIFMVIEPVTIPTARSAPNLIFNVLVFFVFGVIFSIVFIFIKEIRTMLKDRWI